MLFTEKSKRRAVSRRAALLCLIFAASVALSLFTRSASAQFIDRLVRPCATGGSSGLVQVTTTNILLNPCPGGSVTINGTPIVPGPGAPTNATYITQTPNATLTNEQALSTLATGIMFSTTGTGVVTSLGPDLPFANLVQASAASRLIGRGSAAGAGDFQEITLGSGVTMTGTVLSATGSGGTVTGTGTTNKITVWTNGPVGVLGDSHIEDNTAGAFINISPGLFSSIYIDDTIKYLQLVTGHGTNDPQIELDDSGASPLITLTANTGTVRVGGAATFQTPRDIRTGSGAGTDLAGDLTIGGGGTATYAFTQTYTSAPICVCSDTGATPSICGASATTTTLTVRSGAGNVVNYICIGRN